MATTTVSLQRTARFYDSTIGKKAVMAITGLMLFGFVFIHLLGNLQLFLPLDASGRYPIDIYAEKLQHLGGLLWIARGILLGAVILHIWSSISLVRTQMKARPTGYSKKDNAHSSYASRTMWISGPIIACFLIYHLLHFTGGQVHPDFQPGNVYHNVVRGFQQWPAALFYIVGMLLLGGHLEHGFWSLFQSLGVSHPRYTPILKMGAKAFATLIVVGNISMPVSVLLGIVK